MSNADSSNVIEAGQLVVGDFIQGKGTVVDIEIVKRAGLRWLRVHTSLNTVEYDLTDLVTIRRFGER